MHDAHGIARALGGEVTGGRIRCPGPGHSKNDRSMWIVLDWQAPDGFLVGSFAGDDPLACKDYVRAKLGWPWCSGVGISAPKRGPEISTPDTLRTLALTIFKNARPISGTIAESYLRRRIGVALECPDCLRFDPHCVRKVDDRKEDHPALVALMRDASTNEPRAIQRIFLKPDGSDRLRDAKGKATLGPATGAVVKLSQDDAVTLGLGLCEGIETGLALIAAGWSPIWATAGTSGMLNFPVLDGIEQLTIFADNDPPKPPPHKGEAGQRTACALAQRWADAGRLAKVALPKVVGADWLDALREAA